MTPPKTVATVNATGRQAASFVRAASAVGWRVKAHVTDHSHFVAQELADLENVGVVEGSLEDEDFVSRFFVGVDVAFINTLSWGDEVAIGKSLADAAKKRGVRHYIYSSLPDHSLSGKGWPALPLWSVKFMVENYIRQVCHVETTKVSRMTNQIHFRSISLRPSSTRAFTTTTSLPSPIRFSV